MALNDSRIDGLRLPQQEKLALLGSLEIIAKAEYEKYQDCRKGNRYAPIHREAVADLEHPGGSKVSTHVLLYDLSSSAIGFVTRSFLHKATAMSLRMLTRENKVVSIRGQVQRCEYYGAKAHRVVIRLEESIDPRHFVSDEEWEQSTTLADDTSWMSPRSALHIESDALALNAMKMMLDNAMVRCTDADSIGGALDLIQINSYDLILLSEQADQSPGGLEDTIRQIYAHGYTGPVIVISNAADDHGSTLGELGVSRIIPKPVQIGSLMAALRVLFENTNNSLDGTTPIYSTLKEAHCPEGSLCQFIGIAKDLSTRLEIAIKDNDFDSALKHCKSLHSSGSGFGYIPLSTIAGEVAQLLKASGSVKDSACHIRRLIRVISRLRTRDPGTDQKTAA